MDYKRYSKNPGLTEEAAAAKYAGYTSEELRAMLGELEDNYNDIEMIFKARGRANQPHPRYSWKAVHADPYWENGLEGAIKLIGTCINNDEMRAHLNLYGSSAAWDETIHSVTYFRMNGLIIHCSGGHIVLKTPGDPNAFRSSNIPIPCTDEQWDLLYSGTVPTEMLTDYYQK